MSTLRASKPLFVLLAFQPEICAFADPSDCIRLSSASRWLHRSALAHSNGPHAADPPAVVLFPSEEELQRLTRYVLARLADNHRSSGKGGASVTTNGISRRLRSRKRLTAVQVRLLLRDLLLVASGLRTSCLVDCCSLSSESAELLLESLTCPIDGERKVCGITNVHAVLLDGNVFFVNVEVFVREKMVELAGKYREVQYVDISADLAAPQSFQCATDKAVGATRSRSRLERLSRWTQRACEALLEALATSNTRVLQWQKPSDLNATALAGILLCYPVVYDILMDDAMEAECGGGTDDAESGWDKQENCLALCPLVVVQTAVMRVSDQTVITLQEFSVPQHLLVRGQTGSRSKPQDERLATELPLARALRASCVTKLQHAVTKGNLIDAGVQPQVLLSVRTLPRVAL